MGIEAKTNQYWIAPNAVTITLNALGNPNRTQGSVASGAVISCYVEEVKPESAGPEYAGNGDGLGLDNGRNPKRWPLSLSPTYFNSNTAKYVYVAIPRKASVGTQAVVVFPSEHLDIYGKNAEGAQIGSTDYFYVWLQGIISATDGNVNRTWTAKNDFGSLGTYEDIMDMSETDWYQYSKVTGIVTFLKDIVMKAGTTFRNLILNNKELTGVATAATGDEFIDSETLVVTPSYINAKINNRFIRKDQDDETPYSLGVGQNLTVGGDAEFRNNLTVRNILRAVTGYFQSLYTSVIQSENYSGDGIADTGFRLTNDDGTGSSALTVDNLHVRKKATFEELEVKKETAIAGNQIYSCAANIIVRTDYLKGDGTVIGYSMTKVPWLLRKMPFLIRKGSSVQFFGRLRKTRTTISGDDLNEIKICRCYFLAKDGEREIENMWQCADPNDSTKGNDLARCQTMNLKNSQRQVYISTAGEYKIGNVYWWRKVVGVSTDPVNIDGSEYHYIDIAFDYKKEQEGTATDCDYGSDIPAAGDHVVQFGNDSNPDRMHIEVVEINGSDAPAHKIYRGIYTFSMAKCWWGGNARKMLLSPKSGFEFYGPFFRFITEYGVAKVPKDRPEVYWDSITPQRDDDAPHNNVRKCYNYDAVTYNGARWLCIFTPSDDGNHWVRPQVFDNPAYALYDSDGNYRHNGNTISQSDYQHLDDSQKVQCGHEPDYITTTPGTNNAHWKRIVDKGENMMRLDLSNEMDSVHTDSTGKITSNRTITTVVRMFDGAGEVTIGSLTVSSISYTDASGTARTLNPTITTSGLGKQLTWSFSAGWTIAEHINVTISFVYNNVTFDADMTITASMGMAVYQLKPSMSSIPFRRNGSDNTLTPASQTLSLAIVKIDAASSAELTPASYGNTKIRYSFTEMPARVENGTAWPSSGGITVANDKDNVYIALFNIYDVLIDKESVPIVKDGENGMNADVPMQAFQWNQSPTTAPTPLPNGATLGNWSAIAPNRPTTAGDHYLWMTQTLKHTSKSGTISYDTWSTPTRISGDKGDAGEDSSDQEFVYLRLDEYPFPNNVTKPANATRGKIHGTGSWIPAAQQYTNDDWVPEGWYDTALPVAEDNQYVYAAMRNKSAGHDEQWGDFGEPFLWSNWGVQGIDGDGVQYVYKLFDHELTDAERTSNIPTKPASMTDGEWIPTGWSDDPLAPTSSLQYCYCSTIKKINGSWADTFDKLGLWARYSKDGTSPYFADIDEEMDSIALDASGKTTADYDKTINLMLWHGSSAMALTTLSYKVNGGTSYTTEQTISGIKVTPNASAKTIRVRIANATSIATTNEIEITIAGTGSGNHSLHFVLNGVKPGANGDPATIYSLVPSVSSVVKKKDGTYSVDNVSCTRQKNVGGTITDNTTDGTITYKLDGGSEQSYSNNTNIAVTNFTKSIQFVFKIGSTVVDRETILMVADGTDGTSPYFADIDNEMDSVACDKDGKVTAAYSKTIGVSLWHGSSEMTLTDIVISGTTAAVTATKNVANKTITVSVANGTTIPLATELTITPKATGAPNDQPVHFVLNGIRPGQQGPAAVNVVVTPASMIVEQSLSNKNNIEPKEGNNLGQFTIQVLKGTTACTITSISATASQVYISESASAGTYTSRTWQPNRTDASMYLKGVGNSNGAYYDNGQITISITYTDPASSTSKTVSNIIVKVYVNLLGTWKDKVENDTKTEIATSINYLYDPQNPNQVVKNDTSYQSVKSSAESAETWHQAKSSTYDGYQTQIDNTNTRVSDAVSSISTISSRTSVNLFDCADGEGWREYSDDSLSTYDTSIQKVSSNDTYSTAVYLTKDITYVLSFYCNVEPSVMPCYCGGNPELLASDGEPLDELDIDEMSETYKGRNRHKGKFTPSISGYYKFDIYDDFMAYIYRPQIEVGNTPTAWVPGGKNFTSQIKQTANSIDLSIRNGLTRTGINITTGKVAVQADNFTVSKDGTQVFGVDANTGVTTMQDVDIKGSLMYHKIMVGHTATGQSTSSTIFQEVQLTPIAKLKLLCDILLITGPQVTADSVKHAVVFPPASFFKGAEIKIINGTYTTVGGYKGNPSNVELLVSFSSDTEEAREESGSGNVYLNAFMTAIPYKNQYDTNIFGYFSSLNMSKYSSVTLISEKNFISPEYQPGNYNYVWMVVDAQE